VAILTKTYHLYKFGQLRDNFGMCRLFGFRSIFNNQVHSSLVHAENALGNLSQKHRDGWGVAYYLDEVPHLIKSVNCAFDDHIFHKVSGVVSSQNVVAHIRYATNGSSTILNSHPFQFGKWIFAHNGNIKNFDKHKEKLLKLVDKDHCAHILGSTDSEIIFHIILSELKRNNLLYSSANSKTQISKYTQCLKNSLEAICNIIGELTDRDDADPKESYLTFILTNGSTYFAFQGGQPLHYSTHKSLCPERETCKFFDVSCENKSSLDEKVNHLLISSEPLVGDNIWTKMNFGELVCLDSDMTLGKEKFPLPLSKS